MNDTYLDTSIRESLLQSCIYYYCCLTGHNPDEKILVVWEQMSQDEFNALRLSLREVWRFCYLPLQGDEEAKL